MENCERLLIFVGLGQDFFDHLRRLDAGEFLAQALELEAQAVVIDAHLMQDRGVEVADVDAAIDDVVAVVVCAAVLDAGCGVGRMVGPIVTRGLQPTLIDAEEGNPDSGVIFNLDLTEVGWELETWHEVIEDYLHGPLNGVAKFSGLLAALGAIGAVWWALYQI